MVNGDRPTVEVSWSVLRGSVLRARVIQRWVEYFKGEAMLACSSDWHVTVTFLYK